MTADAFALMMVPVLVSWAIGLAILSRAYLKASIEWGKARREWSEAHKEAVKLHEALRALEATRAGLRAAYQASLEYAVQRIEDGTVPKTPKLN